jgi:CO/xanthine dehydrogenase Mo-binding subunit
MEPRGLLAEWDATPAKLTLSGGAKVLFFNRRTLAKEMNLPESAIELVENDVGGGFGARGEFYPEDFLIPFAARHTGRPVKWTEDRREHLMCVNHAREAECTVEIACTRDGTILGLRSHAYGRRRLCAPTARSARNVAQFMSRPYRIPHIDIDVALQLTNKTPVGTYRGPGRFGLISSATLVRHGRAGSRARSRRAPTAEPGFAPGDALPDRHHHAVRARTNSTAGIITPRSTVASRNSVGRRSRSLRAS